MKYKLRFSQSVTRDIESVLTHTLTEFGESKHEQYKNLLRDALKRIAADPSGFPAKHRPEVLPNAYTYHLSRRGRSARHFLLYRLIADDFIHLDRLLHDSMDLRQHLPEEFGGTET